VCECVCMCLHMCVLGVVYVYAECVCVCGVYVVCVVCVFGVCVYMCVYMCVLGVVSVCVFFKKKQMASYYYEHMNGNEESRDLKRLPGLMGIQIKAYNSVFLNV